MRNLIIISLLLTYLFSATEFHQLSKLPFLVEHFVEHKDQNNDLSFWAFLKMHYMNDNAKDSDSAHDTKLPFKSHGDCHNGSIAIHVPQAFSEITISHSFFVERSFSIPRNYSYPSKEYTSIWQPPKLLS